MGDAAPVSRWAQRKQQREQMYASSSDAIQVNQSKGQAHCTGRQDRRILLYSFGREIAFRNNITD